MSEERKEEKKEKVPLQQFRGPVYRCPECGNIYNTFDLKCPLCEMKEHVEGLVELGVAAATMPVDKNEKEAKKPNPEKK